MTLFTLDTNKSKRLTQPLKTAVIFLAASVFCIAFNKIYAVFGHGVSSDSMTFMFLYPLLCGALPYLMISLMVRQTGDVQAYRFSYNSCNSGIVLLTAGSLLNGIFEIAGTSSPYLIIFTVFGWAMFAVGMLTFLINLYRHKRANKYQSHIKGL